VPASGIFDYFLFHSLPGAKKERPITLSGFHGWLARVYGGVRRSACRVGSAMQRNATWLILCAGPAHIKRR